VASVDALAKVLPVLMLIGLGAALRRTDLLRPGTVDDLRRLVLDVTLPAALFLTFLRVTLEGQYALVVGGVFAACLAVFAAALLVVRGAGVRPAVAPGLLAGFEGGMIGYAIFGAVFGQDQLYHFAIVDLGQIPFVFFVQATWLARRASGRSPTLGATLVTFARTPIVLAIAAGVAGSLVGLGPVLDASPVGEAVLRTLALLAAVTTPVIAIVIGYSTRLRRGVLGAPLVTVAIRMAVWVTLALAFNAIVIDGLLGLDRLFQAAVLTLAILPPPFVVPLYLRARRGAGPAPGGDPAAVAHERLNAAEHEYAVNTLALATVATLVAFVAVAVAFAG
jgi:malate permease and related proteins